MIDRRYYTFSCNFKRNYWTTNDSPPAIQPGKWFDVKLTSNTGVISQCCFFDATLFWCSFKVMSQVIFEQQKGKPMLWTLAAIKIYSSGPYTTVPCYLADIFIRNESLLGGLYENYCYKLMHCSHFKTAPLSRNPPSRHNHFLHPQIKIT